MTALTQNEAKQLKDLPWKKVSTGMPDEWYGSREVQENWYANTPQKVLDRYPEWKKSLKTN